MVGRGSSNDILGTAGFLTALRDVMRLAKGALLWVGLPCSSCLTLRYICMCVRHAYMLMLGYICWVNIYDYACACVPVGVRLSLHVLSLLSCTCMFTLELRWVWLSSGTHQRHLSVIGDERHLNALVGEIRCAGL